MVLFIVSWGAKYLLFPWGALQKIIKKHWIRLMIIKSGQKHSMLQLEEFSMVYPVAQI